DRAAMGAFFRDQPPPPGSERDPESPLGVWRSEAEVAALAAAGGWRVAFRRMPPTFYAAHYRFDAVLTPAAGAWVVGATIERLALFGGRPTFDRPRSIGQLSAPDVEDCLALMKQAFDARRLTNDGPIVGKLEDALTAFHQTRHCVAVANAALGITMLI